MPSNHRGTRPPLRVVPSRLTMTAVSSPALEIQMRLSALSPHTCRTPPHVHRGDVAGRDWFGLRAVPERGRHAGSSSRAGGANSRQSPQSGDALRGQLSDCDSRTMKIYRVVTVKYREIAWIVFSCGLNGSCGEFAFVTLRYHTDRLQSLKFRIWITLKARRMPVLIECTRTPINRYPRSDPRPTTAAP